MAIPIPSNGIIALFDTFNILSVVISLVVGRGAASIRYLGVLHCRGQDWHGLEVERSPLP